MSTGFHEGSRRATLASAPSSIIAGIKMASSSATAAAAAGLSVAGDVDEDDAEEEEDSWEEYDDEPIVLHRGGKPRADRRKVIDNTTPTLEDEDRHNHRHHDRHERFCQGHEHSEQQRSGQSLEEEEDEEEEIKMISLEQERITRTRFAIASNASATADPSATAISINVPNHRHHRHHSDEDDRSLRRTPGAIQMHHSSRTELLAFGLAMTTPLPGSSEGLRKDLRNLDARPPRDPNDNASSLVQRNKREDLSYTPASYALTMNPHIQVSHGAFSPNTLRLTEDLDNLLDEEEDELRHQIYRDNVETESWTKQYIFESEGGTAELTRMGKKNRRASGRRSRGSTESPREYTPRQDQFHHTVHDQTPSYQVRGHDVLRPADDDVHQPLNFGGAFAPPSDRGIFQRPVPSSAQNDHPFQRPIPTSTNNGPLTFSSYNKPLAFQHQTFNPHVFVPHPQAHHDLHMGYPSSSPSPMFNHSLGTSMTGMPPLRYDQRSPRLASSFVPPNNYVQAQQQHHQSPPLHHSGGWAPITMPPNNNINPYANHLPPPVFAPPQHLQQHQPSRWGEDHGQGIEAPWMDNSSLGYGLPSFQNHLTPITHVYQQLHQHHHQQTLYWQDMHNLTYETRNSPVVAPPLEPYPSETEKLVLNVNEGPFDDVDSAKPIGKEVRTIHKSSDKKDSKIATSLSKIDKIRQRNKKKTSSNYVNTPSSCNVKVSSTVPVANINTTAKRVVVRGQKVEDEIDDAAEAKRAGLVESPETRAAFKEFYRNFRLHERASIQDAEKYAVNALQCGVVPDRTHWRIYLELADLAKRSNKFGEARKLYAQVCELQPFASQGWLEYSKLEEECGCMKRCSKILNEGLKYCAISENLLNRAIKHEEKMNNLTRARELLARLKHVGIEKVWRTVLEGALLEGRVGNHAMARRVLKYLMHHVPWYGPLYLEAYRLERDLGRPEEALRIVERGLKAIPRYGPLWFGAFRLCEALDFDLKAYHLPQTTAMFERAVNSISRELVWKVHLDAAQILERAALSSVNGVSDLTVDGALDVCRKRVAMTALGCPSNLSWKVWLAGGRMELSAGNVDVARSLFLRAHRVVPEKGRVATLLECARLEEFALDVDLARAILCKSRSEHSTDWKVWLESVFLEIRDGKPRKAVHLAEQALERHSGTGRLWASLVQLRYFEGGEEAQFLSLKSALRSVPKSGEVWCEGGRMHLNPFSQLFSLSEARRHLFFATRFTPQYGDGFLETVRLEMIERWVLPMASCVWEAIHPLFQFYIEELDSWVSSLVVASVKLVRAASSGMSSREFDGKLFDKSVVPSLRAQLEAINLDDVLDTSTLELRCANADPNYGSMWFNCRNSPTDTARVIMRRARGQILTDLKTYSYIYVAAIIRSCGIMFAAQHHTDPLSFDSMTAKAFDKEKELAKITPSVETILQSSKEEISDDTALLESSISEFHFVSGLVILNRHKPLCDMSLLERKKVLFGSDALFA